jgi:hypothetical protein
MTARVIETFERVINGKRFWFRRVVWNDMRVTVGAGLLGGNQNFHLWKDSNR